MLTTLEMLCAAALLCLGDARTQSLHRVAARANRLALLLQRPAQSLSVAEGKELAGLREVETYDEAMFTPEHAVFKAAHNAMFVALARHAGGGAGEGAAGSAGGCFYLDGPSGGTTAALVAAGYARSGLFTANWHPETVAALRRQLPEENVAAARADAALRSEPLAAQPLAALYIDGCVGSRVTYLVYCG